MSPKQLGGKASRFTHTERLQFTKEDEKNVVVASSREEEKEEEINRVKQELDEVSLRCEELEQEIRALSGSISRVEEECKDQEEANKKLQESIGVKEKIVKLIKDAPNNIVRLKEEIGNWLLYFTFEILNHSSICLFSHKIKFQCICTKMFIITKCKLTN